MALFQTAPQHPQVSSKLPTAELSEQPNKLSDELGQPSSVYEDRLNLQEFCFLAALSLLILVSWVGATLAELGLFGFWRVSICVVVIASAGAILFRRRIRRFLPRVNRRLEWREWIPIGGLLLLAAVILFPGFEYLDGGRDPGVYINTGIILARTRGLLLEDIVAQAVLPEATPLLFPKFIPGYLSKEIYQRFLGFQFANGLENPISPQFMPVFPAWLALAYSAGGLAGLWVVTPAFGVAAVIAVYLAGRMLLGPSAGLIAGLLLALNPAHIYFSRYPSSEIPAMLLLFAGLAAFYLFQRTQRWWIGIIAGAAVGLLPLLKFDLFVALGVVGFYSLWELWNGRLGRALPFLVPQALLGLQATLHIYLLSPAYFQLFEENYGLTRSAIYLLAALSVLTLAVLLVRRRWRESRPSGDRYNFPLALVTTTIIAALGLYALFIRPVGPQIPPDDLVPGFQYDSWNLVRLSWFVGWPLVALAVVGWYLAVRRRLTPATGLFLAIALVSSVLFLDQARIHPLLMYSMRRYLPVVVPSILLLASLALVQLWQSQRWRWPGRALVAGALLIAGLNLLPTSFLYWQSQEHAGFPAQVEAFRVELTASDILLFTEEWNQSYFGTPLWSQYGYHPFALQGANMAGLERQIERWRSEGRQVLVITARSVYQAGLAGWELRRLSAKTYEWPELETTFDRAPSKIKTLRTTLTIYEVVKS